MLLRARGSALRKCGEVLCIGTPCRDPSAFTVGETEIDLEFSRRQHLESPAPMTPQREVQTTPDDFAPPGAEIDPASNSDWNKAHQPMCRPR